MSIKKSEAGTLKDQAKPGQDPGPPLQQDNGDIVTPNSQSPTEDDKPLE